MPRFYVWALGKLPTRLVLTPEDGEFVQWVNGETFSLSAPIIRTSLEDLIDEQKMDQLHNVFQAWVRFDGENCDLIRQSLLSFRMPPSYRTNELPPGSICEVGYALPEPEFLERGILKLAESAECIGGQLFRQGDRAGGLRATLLVYHLWKTYPEVFKKSPRWTGSLPGDMGMKICTELNDAVVDQENAPYVFRGLDQVGKALENDPVVSRFLKNG